MHKTHTTTHSWLLTLLPILAVLAVLATLLATLQHHLQQQQFKWGAWSEVSAWLTDVVRFQEEKFADGWGR
jgi:hypothetical protein